MENQEMNEQQSNVDNVDQIVVDIKRDDLVEFTLAGEQVTGRYLGNNSEHLGKTVLIVVPTWQVKHVPRQSFCHLVDKLQNPMKNGELVFGERFESEVVTDPKLIEHEKGLLAAWKGEN